MKAILKMQERNPSSSMPGSATGVRNLTQVYHKLASQNINPLKKLYIVDVACGPSRTPTLSTTLCPCLTRTRAGVALSLVDAVLSWQSDKKKQTF